MMKFNKLKITGFLLFLVLGFTSCEKDKPDIVYKKSYIEPIKKARNEFMFFLSANLIPGGSIAISKGGEIIYSEAIGLASKDLNVPANRKTKYRIGPLTELFTSLSYHLLVEEGVLHPDSSVQYYLPDFPEKEYTITLDNLINHTSGIRQETATEEVQANLNVTLEKGIKVFENDDLLFPSGYYQMTSSLNYNLLGAAMEKATGKKFNDILYDLVIDTLHLENTVMDNPFITIKDRGDFFDQNVISLIINSATVDLRSKAPSRGLLSTAEDLVKFGNAFLYSDYITEDIKNKIFTLPELKSGMIAENTNGWVPLIDKSKRTIYSLTGYVTGGGASLLIFPEEELVVAIAINTTMKGNNPPDYSIASYFFPEDETGE